jgi:SAM-dependent methyltransferase
MLGLLRKMYLAAHASAEAANFANIRSFAAGTPPGPSRRLLDLGCDDGRWSMAVGAACGIGEVHGVELVETAALAAERAGVIVHRGDLNDPFPLESGSFDVVHSNQVIEHVNDVDQFVAEIYRVLKPGGLAIVSTENGSSWHNVFASAMGWQMFSLTNVSAKVSGLGNPFAVHRGQTAFAPTWRHKIIMNYRGLLELFQVNGFEDVRVRGAGYYPFAARLGAWDPRHAAFLTILARKPA